MPWLGPKFDIRVIFLATVCTTNFMVRDHCSALKYGSILLTFSLTFAIIIAPILLVVILDCVNRCKDRSDPSLNDSEEIALGAMIVASSSKEENENF